MIDVHLQCWDVSPPRNWARERVQSVASKGTPRRDGGGHKKSGDFKWDFMKNM